MAAAPHPESCCCCAGRRRASASECPGDHPPSLVVVVTVVALDAGAHRPVSVQELKEACVRVGVYELILSLKSGFQTMARF